MNSWGRHYRTLRGFTAIEFVDRYNKECSLQDSSLASEAAIWLGMEGHRMHLTQQQVDELIPLLQHFVDEGRLPIPPEESDG